MHPGYLMAGAMLGAGHMAYQGGKQTNAANMEMMKYQQKFQAEMSNTAYQRTMSDMKAAGLNPILAGKVGGASTPSGGMATMQNAAAQAAPYISGAGNAFMEGAKAAADIKLINANEALTSTKNVLAENLVPGSEAIATLTGELSKLAKAASSMINSNVETYESAIEGITNHVNDLYQKWNSLDLGLITDHLTDKVKGVLNKLGFDFDTKNSWTSPKTGIRHIQE